MCAKCPAATVYNVRLDSLRRIYLVRLTYVILYDRWLAYNVLTKLPPPPFLPHTILLCTGALLFLDQRLHIIIINIMMITSRAYGGMLPFRYQFSLVTFKSCICCCQYPAVRSYYYYILLNSSRVIVHLVLTMRE